MTDRRRLIILSATLLLTAAAAAQAQTQPPARAQGPGGPPVNTIQEIFDRLERCWKPPSLSAANPMDITVSFSFNRSGAIMGKPRITYESVTATDSDRLAYRVAVMEALERCSPMPFTESMAGAIAGRPLKVLFHTHAATQEKRI